MREKSQENLTLGECESPLGSNSSKNKVEKLNSLLMSIRTINKLIVQGNDILSILNGAGKILLETLHYINIEISLLSQAKGKIVPVASAGDFGYGSWHITPAGNGNAPNCIKKAVKAKRTLLIDDQQKVCLKCPDYDTLNPHIKLIIPLHNNNRLTGLMAICAEVGHSFFQEEIDLLEEVANDLTFARGKFDAEETIRESELRYRLLFENSKDAMMTLEPPSWRFSSGNQAIFEIFRVNDLAEFTACEPWRLSPKRQPDGLLSVKKAKRMIDKAMQEGSNFFEWTHRRKDGEIFPATVLLTRIEMKGHAFLHATVRDISDRKRDEIVKKIQTNIAHAVTVADSIHDLYETVRDELAKLLDTKNCYIAFYNEKTGTFSTPFEKDVKDSIQQWNAEKSLTEYTIKKNRAILLSKDEIESLVKADVIKKIGTTAESWLGVPIQIGGNNAAVLVLQSYENKDAYDQDSLELLELIANQLSVYIEHKQTESTLLFEREQMLSIFDSISELVYVSDPSTYEIIYVNRFMMQEYNREIVGSKCYEELHKKSEPCAFCTNGIIMENKGTPYQWEYYNPLNDKHYLIIDRIIKWPDGRDVRFELAIDVTKHRQAEEEAKDLQAKLIHSQKLDEIGRLAGGIAHDFNNMLGVILGHTDMLLTKADQNNPFYKNIVEIRKAADRSANLTKQLLAFARKQTINPQRIDLNNNIQNMLDMLKRLIGENIDLHWLPSSDLWSVRIDPTQIDQILTNLCINSRDAIDGIGDLAIKTANVILENDPKNKNPDYRAGEFVMLTTEDSGCGMDEETLKNIFEPFFTTKGVGKGSGLGLSTIYGIVRQNDGFIDVCSELGNGTIFKIYLPRNVREAPKINKTEKSQEKILASGHGNILLVEDELSILEMMTTMLEDYGYRVFPFHLPLEALRFLKSTEEEIDLLITDIVMPKMDGYDLSLKLQTIRPNIKVLFMSGYIDALEKRIQPCDTDIHFIQKPFTEKDILARIRTVVDN